MNNTSVLYGIIGFLLGIVLTIVVVNNQMYGMMRMMGMGGAGDSMQRGMMMDQDHDGDGMSMSMSEMQDELTGKTGEEFDKAFLTNMIVHHQGAIEMATLAKQNAQHTEIKQLSDEIIAAQTKEINQMRDWQQAWATE